MTADEAKKVLHNPDIVFVLTALSFVNLRDRELDVLILRHMRGHTQEQTAEEMELSVNCVQGVEKAALKKCAEVWEHLIFVKSVLKGTTR